jgi:hypothetical protein
MFKKLIRFLNNSDERDRIKRLEHNEKILQNYIIALSRLLFFPPEHLNRETNNTEANNRYIEQLYELSKKKEEPEIPQN